MPERRVSGGKVLRVRVLVADIPGLEIATAVGPDGTIWQVIGRDAPRPHHAYADVMEELFGSELPGTLTYEVAPPPLPVPRQRDRESTPMRLVS